MVLDGAILDSGVRIGETEFVTGTECLDDTVGNFTGDALALDGNALVALTKATVRPMAVREADMLTMTKMTPMNMKPYFHMVANCRIWASVRLWRRRPLMMRWLVSLWANRMTTRVMTA